MRSVKLSVEPVDNLRDLWETEVGSVTDPDGGRTREVVGSLKLVWWLLKAAPRETGGRLRLRSPAVGTLTGSAWVNWCLGADGRSKGQIFQRQKQRRFRQANQSSALQVRTARHALKLEGANSGESRDSASEVHLNRRNSVIGGAGVKSGCAAGSWVLRRWVRAAIRGRTYVVDALFVQVIVCSVPVPFSVCREPAPTELPLLGLVQPRYRTIPSSPSQSLAAGPRWRSPTGGQQCRRRIGHTR
jgi:hypothetical protein